MENSQTNYGIPVAIIIAGLIIAGAIYYRGTAPSGSNLAATTEEQLAQIRPLATSDHWRGAAEAEVVLVEYSDLECPFCKDLHPTLQTLIDQDPRVAWVYRHFPLDQLHPKARTEAKAAECAAKLAGPEGSLANHETFWRYVDKVFAVTPSNNGLDLTLLPQLAEEIGLEPNDFNDCLASDFYDEQIQADLDNAVAGGGTGTPFTVLMTADGRRVALEGNRPLDQIQAVIETVLADQ